MLLRIRREKFLKQKSWLRIFFSFPLRNSLKFRLTSERFWEETLRLFLSDGSQRRMSFLLSSVFYLPPEQKLMVCDHQDKQLADRRKNRQLMLIYSDSANALLFQSAWVFIHDQRSMADIFSMQRFMVGLFNKSVRAAIYYSLVTQTKPLLTEARPLLKVSQKTAFTVTDGCF